MTRDRSEQRRIAGAHDGATTRDRHGSAHYRTIGKAGYDQCAKTHGAARCLGIIRGKGWQPATKPNLADDLRLAQW